MKITNETTVTINYRVSEQNGELLEQTSEDNPVTYLHGLGMMLPAVEEALEGKVPGDSLKLELKAAEAYGEPQDYLIVDIPAKNFEELEELEIGKEVVIANSEEGEMIMTIVGITEDTVTIDGNHPFAGKDIVFEINVVDVHKTTDEDLKAFESEHNHDQDIGCGYNCGCGDNCGGH